jgi:hypothetical protein
MMMGKLRLGAIVEDKPVRMTVELPAALHRDLLAYAAMHGEENWAAAPAGRAVGGAGAGDVHGQRPRLCQGAPA